jgi:hypothetical protein
MKSKIEIKQELQLAVNSLPFAKSGMPSALVRLKIKLLQWVLY